MSEYQGLDRRVLRLWRLGVAISMAVLAVIAGAVILAVAAADGPTVVVALVSGLGLPALGLLLWWMTNRRFTAWGYRFTDEAIELRMGRLFRSQLAVPYRRIQQVDVLQGPLQRRAGLVSLTVRTAAAAATPSLPGIDAAQAETVRSELLRRSGHDDAS